MNKMKISYIEGNFRNGSGNYEKEDWSEAEVEGKKTEKE